MKEDGKTVDRAMRLLEVLGQELEELTMSITAWLAENTLTRKVLVVEDDPANRMFLTIRISKSLGVPVESTGSGVEAQKMWANKRHGVVVMDVQLMEKETGVHIAHSLGRGPRVILVSGVADVQLLTDVARNLHADWMTKPYDTEKLMELVRQNLDSAAPLASST